MKPAVQQRTLKTRANLVAAARAQILQEGYEALRIEDVIARAGVAKGTFFAHFTDKDSLMDLLIGEQIDSLLDALEGQPPPATVRQLVNRLMPLLEFMSSERYVFDVILRRSGAAAREEIGPIAMTFGRFEASFVHFLGAGVFRNDIPPKLLAEGVQAFMIQAIALNFCALHNQLPLRERLTPYLKAWLTPGP